jgi:hypothetical protein
MTWRFEASAEKSREYTGINRHRQWLANENSNGSTTKRKDWLMGLHEIKLLYNKRNGHQIEEAAHRMGENLCSE